ncbi:ABC-2 type transport system ATP-binding protein [Desulfoscipio geothermicus DSM 3669]|uniref:ABC-2 type transport system ATP-binding protein n=2 Tax=Desulfoscipio geothermicus TaxID=39060 RepID=A0A1I6DID9_9FIRM|nr:ABC-2 type transport system ATP-binding protein [Desulfoscipio geothermicus DSM 3669]
MDMAIKTFNLTKKYGTKIGCAEICLRVPRGQIFGFLGPNGAGKSTLVKMLVGLLFPTSGKALLLDRPLGDTGVRARIGFLPENFRYHDWLTGQQLLEFHASLYGLSGTEKKRRVGEVLELVGLAGRERQKIHTYSKGMRQRAGLACALLPDPDLLFLDEPTSALDPIGRRDVREILVSLRASGKTIFLNSHLLSEVELICDAVAFIRQGKIIRQGSLEDLQTGDITVEMKVGNLTREMVNTLSSLARSLEVRENVLMARVKREEDIPRLAEAVVTGGGDLFEMNRKRSTLEEMFIRTTGGGEEIC